MKRNKKSTPIAVAGDQALDDTLRLYMPSSFEDGKPTVELESVLAKIKDLSNEEKEAVSNLVIGAYLEGQDAVRDGLVVES